ncbi:MAG: tRNA (adenosine(37)-N6)-dimethylallyltransferase MiaA, partial [Ignavibacteria bacterium]|nr:tRNA (adenosine(37)-N6)-dimethylallyltransferase MiaA [Ignavibacteria bacterium]
MKKTLITIVGPTAVGKTSFAINLALKFGTEIISADSRQIYRQLKIGTAKPTHDQLTLVKHHFIDYLNIDEDFNAGEFEKRAIETILDIFTRKDIA